MIASALENFVIGIVRRELAARPAAPTAAATSRYLAAGDVAKLIGCPSRKALEMKLVRARKRGEFHPLEKLAIEIDGARRWREADVIAWVEAQR